MYVRISRTGYGIIHLGKVGDEKGMDLERRLIYFGCSPCRVVRPVGERDREFYFRDRRIDPGLSEE